MTRTALSSTGPLVEREQVQQLRQQAVDLERNARQFIERNPTTALVGALALGFVVGRLVTR